MPSKTPHGLSGQGIGLDTNECAVTLSLEDGYSMAVSERWSSLADVGASVRWQKCLRGFSLFLASDYNIHLYSEPLEGRRGTVGFWVSW
jgi:hypothetical protein